MAGLSSADGQETAVRPQRTMDCLFVRTQFTVPIPSAPCCLQKVVLFNLIKKVPRFLSGGLGLFCFSRSLYIL
jgi:hypothetical protein